MTAPEQHEMILEERQASGAEVWWCPTCGRRMVLRWLPTYEKLVLSRGHEHALHVGGTGGLSMRGVVAAPA
ncbi:MAG TPA: hypothetical protein VG276_06255 [Actinomycetes bacterium]|jgi:hypothetical protein|nr:hypothetical protein [Actinomycetes bacterium]